MNIADIPNQQMQVFSFDVFDTTLTRKTGEPVGIFYILEKKLIEQTDIVPIQIAQDFVRLRIQSEIAARKKSNNEEITIYQIYDSLNEQFNLPKDIIEFLINMEIEEELNAIVAVPQIMQILESLRNQNARVIFVSDSYLPKVIIQKMLNKVGAIKDGDGLYVSSDVLLTKETGNLFLHILETEKCSKTSILHIGDNFASDVNAARRIGIQAFHFTEVKLNRYEKSFIQGTENNPSRYDYKWQMVAGASRLARLYSIETKDHHTLNCLGANVAGPILVSYVIWILHEAKSRCLHRLYFIARDGQILLEISRKLTNILGWDIELRYLYGSRQAWHLPATFIIEKRELEWLLEADPVLSLRIFSNRAELDPEIVKDELFSATGRTWNIDQNLKGNEIDILYKIIPKTKLSSMILARAKEARAKTVGYFRQEGLMDDISWGIVDLGWQGRMQDSLKRILVAEGSNAPIYGFYFGLCRSLDKEDTGNHKLSFFFSPCVADSFWTIGNRSANFMEIFTAADHGTTLYYYKDSNEIWYPKLKQEDNGFVLNWGLEYLREGILKFLNLLSLDILKELGTNMNIYREHILLLMKLLIFSPSKDEAEVIGCYPFSSDQAETNLMSFAPHFTIFAAIRYGVKRNSRHKVNHTYWIEGTCLNSGYCARFFLLPSIQKILGFPAIRLLVSKI